MAVEESLWRQAAAGDRTAFESFYLRHADTVYTHCLARARSVADAQDLTADVFEIAWTSRSNVTYHQDSADILPWLLATANNLLHSHHRATRRRPSTRLFGRDEPMPDIADLLADDAQLRDDLALAMAVLRGLKPEDQDVIEMCVTRGIAPGVVAKEMGVPASTMRTRLGRALARARAGLAQARSESAKESSDG